MANYYGTGRSNYVRVTNEAVFREAVERLNCEVIESNGRFGLMDSNDDGSGFYFYNPEEDADLDPIALLSPLLADGEVMVITEAGHEKHRYVTGWALAFNSKGEYRDLNLDGIYKLAEELGTNITRAEY